MTMLWPKLNVKIPHPLIKVEGAFVSAFGEDFPLSNRDVARAVSVGDLLNYDPGAGPAPIIPDLSPALKFRQYRAHTGTSDTFVYADGGHVVTSNNAGVVTQTIPSNAAVPFPIDTIVEVLQLGAGTLNIAITTDTLLVPSGFIARCLGQRHSVFCKKIGVTTWVLSGALAVA